jgi:hypothetical protein
MLAVTKRGRPRKPGPVKTGKTVRLPQDLWAAVEDYIAAQRPRPDLTEVLQVAVEDFLSAKGFWPRQNND